MKRIVCTLILIYTVLQTLTVLAPKELTSTWSHTLFATIIYTASIYLASTTMYVLYQLILKMATNMKWLVPICINLMMVAPIGMHIGATYIIETCSKFVIHDLLLRIGIIVILTIATLTQTAYLKSHSTDVG